MPHRSISNAVLLEKITQVKEQSEDNSVKLEELKNNVTNNFSSLANVLREGYATKSELARVETNFRETVDELRRDISKRVHKDTFKPYAWVLNTIGGLSLVGFMTLVGKVILDYLRGGPPQ
jgi:hypothetical protein